MQLPIHRIKQSSTVKKMNCKTPLFYDIYNSNKTAQLYGNIRHPGNLFTTKVKLDFPHQEKLYSIYGMYFLHIFFQVNVWNHF
jgi:hypothetical protein